MPHVLDHLYTALHCSRCPLLACHMHLPCKPHMLEAKRVLACIQLKIKYGIKLHASNSTLIGYADASYGPKPDRKSVTGYIMSSCGPIAWKSGRQTVVAQSSMEAEYIAASTATKEKL